MTERSCRPALLSRRAALMGLGVAGLPVRSAPALAQTAMPAAPAALARTLTAGPARARLRPAPALDTEIWAFDGATPGPALRIKLGETLRLTVTNKTTAPLSLHWHGLRGEAAMDGVGGFSQAPIAPGASFEYRLTPPDSGTILYRPLVIGAAAEPAARGLSGMLIVEEAEPPPVDLDLPVLVTDWLLGDDNALQPFAPASPEGA
ncbi:MAG: multicopper oxidase family protein, partial [Alsobacter sp.]